MQLKASAIKRQCVLFFFINYDHDGRHPGKHPETSCGGKCTKLRHMLIRRDGQSGAAASVEESRGGPGGLGAALGAMCPQGDLGS